jgi:hypothetical protein
VYVYVNNRTHYVHSDKHFDDGANNNIHSDEHFDDRANNNVDSD